MDGEERFKKNITKKTPYFVEQPKRKLAIPLKKSHIHSLYPSYWCKGVFVGGGAVGRTMKGGTTQNKGVEGKRGRIITRQGD